MLDHAEVPLEFRGLLYIDARESLTAGLNKLSEFFRHQLQTVSEFRPRLLMRKSFDEREQIRRECQVTLSGLSIGDFRYHLSQRLSIEQMEVIWFDVFNKRMADEVQIKSVAMCCVEILDRSLREERLGELIDAICRNHPKLYQLMH